VKNAQTAVNCQSSSPLIEKSEFTQNQQAIKIQGVFSKPLIRNNTIYKNKGIAILILDEAAPRILENTIQENDQTGLMVQSAGGEVENNTITRNKNSGIAVQGSQAVIRANNLVDNQPYNISGQLTGSPAKAQDNWWGSAKMADVLQGIHGHVDVSSVLDAPWPLGKSLNMPILEKNIQTSINLDSYLILLNSPYRVIKDVTIDGGATLYIEPGVVVEFEQKTALIAKNGGIIARGTKEKPITFTAASSSPTPGFYVSAIRFVEATKVNSAFAYCIVKYATTAFDIYAGAPEISYSHIANSSQNAVYCRKDSSPVISYSTFKQNYGEGAITCVGSANPLIFQNNFIGNTMAIQSFSTIYIDARNNWWGATPPDPQKIWLGENINIKPWLEKENTAAFKEAK
jgi:parallel beta-helix repeat protein